MDGDEKAFITPSDDASEIRSLAEREVDIANNLSSRLRETAAFCEEALKLTRLMRRAGYHSTLIEPKEAALRSILMILNRIDEQ